MSPTIQEAFSILREVREQQLHMAELVAAAIATRTHLIIEAGTGTGKSFGYLIPAISQGKRIVVATYTIALQEQLMRYDIPFLQKAMLDKFGIRFRAAMLKGAANYLCVRRFKEAIGDGQFDLGEVRTLPESVVDWGCETETGDMGEAPPMDFAVQASIRIDLDDCGKRACPYFAECHHQRARRDAKTADVLIINQAGLATAMKSPYFLDLSGYSAIVIDEAHQWEDVAREAFGAELKPSTLKRLFTAVEREIVKKDHEDRPDWDAVSGEFRAAWGAAISYWMRLEDEHGKPMLWEKKWVAMNSGAVTRAAEAISALGTWLEPRLDGSEPHKKIGRQLDTIRSIFTNLGTDGAITVASRDIKQGATVAQVTIETKPLFVGPLLQDSLYNERETTCDDCDGKGREHGGIECYTCNGGGRMKVPGLPVIYCSATISTGGGDFTIAKAALGLAPATTQAEIGSPFDYPDQALLYIPTDCEPPAFGGSRDAKDAAVAKVYQEIENLLNLSRGRAFVLFTASKAMKDAFFSRKHRWPTRWQEPNSNKNELIAWFKQTPNAVLYATASFWEGVSIEGEQLSLVIIDKVPNTPPDDPVYQAKAAHYGYSQGESFGRLGVPAAIVKLKQGFGRLIRTQADRGVVAILDSRIHSKGYGRRIIAALPPARLVTSIFEIGERYFTQPVLAQKCEPVAVECEVMTDEPDLDTRIAALMESF